MAHHQKIMFKSEDIEIRDQAHLMDAEGCHDEKPTEQEIVQYLESKGFSPNSNIDIWLDGMQGFWRWVCLIKRGVLYKDYIIQELHIRGMYEFHHKDHDGIEEDRRCGSGVGIQDCKDQIDFLTDSQS